MRLHSPLVGVYGPSLTCRHWGFLVSPADFVAPQVEASSVQCLGSLHNPTPVGHWLSLICLQCSYPRMAQIPMKIA